MISRTFSIAFDVSSIIVVASRSHSGFFSLWLGRALFLLIVANRGFDRVLCQNRAMNLNRRQVQFFDDRRILDVKRFIDRSPLEPFVRRARACDGRTATERLELRVLDDLRL